METFTMESCECFNSIIGMKRHYFTICLKTFLLKFLFITAGAYLLEVKSEKKLTDILKSKKISCTFYNQWILLCFNKIVSDFQKAYNGNNTVLKHIYVPPLLKIIMEKLMHNLSSCKSVKTSEKDHELIATLNALSCFFQKLYECQIESIGKIDSTVIEKTFDCHCLNIAILIECFLNSCQKKTKLESMVFMNSMLKINFMWRKMEKFISLQLDLSREILITLSSIEEETYENIILEKLIRVVIDTTRRKQQLVSIDLN